MSPGMHGSTKESFQHVIFFRRGVAESRRLHQVLCRSRIFPIRRPPLRQLLQLVSVTAVHSLEACAASSFAVNEVNVGQLLLSTQCENSEEKRGIAVDGHVIGFAGDSAGYRQIYSVQEPDRLAGPLHIPGSPTSSR